MPNRSSFRLQWLDRAEISARKVGPGIIPFVDQGAEVPNYGGQIGGKGDRNTSHDLAIF